MRDEPLVTFATLFGFLFTLARVSGTLAFLPLAAFRAAPETARIVLALAFTILLQPEWKTPVSADASLGRFASGLAAEAALGLAIGVGLAIALEIFQVAAQTISLAAGFGYASTIDPASGADSTVLLTVAQLFAGLLFFVSGADRLFVKALADSLRLAPPESFAIQKTWALAMAEFAGGIFGAGLRLAAPVIALLLLADLSLAVLGRVQAQLHLVSLTIPVKLAATMLLMSLTIVLHKGFFDSWTESWLRLVEGILLSAAKGGGH